MFPYKFYFMSVDMKAEVKKEGQEFRLTIDTPSYSGSHVFRTREQALSEMSRIANILLIRQKETEPCTHMN